MDEAASAELELLQAMFSADELEVAETSVACLLKPRTGGAALSRHVQAWLHIELPPTYPVAPPRVRLQRTRGLIDREEAHLLRAVLDCTADRPGECCLFDLLEVGSDAITEINGGGECPVCCDALCGDDSGAHVFLSPCFHSFHATCIGTWWHCYEPPLRVAPGAPSGSETEEPQAGNGDAAAMAARAGAAEVCVGRLDADP